MVTHLIFIVESNLYLYVCDQFNLGVLTALSKFDSWSNCASKQLTKCHWLLAQLTEVNIWKSMFQTKVDKLVRLYAHIQGVT